MAYQVRRGDVLPGLMAIVLAGGQGERLFPLTRDRAKPAVPFGASYRIIDFTLSNCLNSGLRRIHVLTQYKSDSLNRHIRHNWNVFNADLGEYIEINPPQLRLSSQWYMGTADAICQNIYTLERERPEHILILGGDHVYKMDYSLMFRQHRETGADLTLACIPVPLAVARRFGVLSVGHDMRVEQFHEKPAAPPPLNGSTTMSLCSMGVYIFRTEKLVRRVVADAKMDTSHDFGQDVIPAMIRGGDRVCAFCFGQMHAGQAPYWRDIGTLDAYWESNMDLVRRPHLFELNDPEWPVRGSGQCAAPAMMTAAPGEAGERRADVNNALVACGSVVRGARVEQSVVGRGVLIEPGAEVIESVIMDGVVIGPDAAVHRAIVDKGNVIPSRFRIGLGLGMDRHGFSVSEGGIVVVPKEMPLFRG